VQSHRSTFWLQKSSLPSRAPPAPDTPRAPALAQPAQSHCAN
jgi:hypothetical protein